MPAPYPLPQNLTSLGLVAQYVHSVDPNFFNFLLITLWIIVFLGLQSTNIVSIGSSFTTASAITFVLGLVLIPVGITANNVLMVTALLIGIGILWVMNESRG